MDDELKDLLDRVKDLENRVGYLEHAVGESYDEHRFKQKMGSLFGRDDFEVNSVGRGMSATSTVAVKDVALLARKVDRLEGLEWGISESDEENTVVFRVSNTLEYNI